MSPLPAPRVNQCLHMMFYLPERRVPESCYDSDEGEKQPLDQDAPLPPIRPSRPFEPRRTVWSTKQPRGILLSADSASDDDYHVPRVVTAVGLAALRQLHTRLQETRRPTPPPSPPPSPSLPASPVLKRPPPSPEPEQEAETQSGSSSRKKRPSKKRRINPPFSKLPPGQPGGIQLHAHDIVFGTGPIINMHPGNQRLRQLATEMRPRYRAEPRSSRTALVRQLIGTIQVLDPPGRFLDFNEKGEYVIADDNKVHEKTCHLVRGRKGNKNWVSTGHGKKQNKRKDGESS